MTKFSEFTIQKFTIILGFIYFFYSISLTIYDISHLKYVHWVRAENQSTVYSSRRSTTVTYNFVKNGVRISRKYPGILEGINTWMWGINKSDKTASISFFIKEKDYNKIINNEIRNRRDIFGNKLNELESIPFFGLRMLTRESNTFLLILDIWKYNYSILLAFSLLVLPYVLLFIVKEVFKINIRVNDDIDEDNAIGTYLILSFVLLLVNLIV